MKLCSTAQAAWYGFTKSQYYRLRLTMPSALKSGKSRRPSETRCISWMKAYFEEHAQHHPSTSRRWLPPGQTMTTVLNQYLFQCTYMPVSRATFYRIWRASFSDVTIPAFSPFSVCAICAEFKEARRRLHSPTALTAVQGEYDLHIARCM